MTQQKLDVLTVGEPLAESSDHETTSGTAAPGGDALNVAVAVARLGGQAGLASRLGDDTEGAVIADFLTREGVDQNDVTTVSGSTTGRYHIHINENGHQFTYDRAESAASGWGVNDASRIDLSRSNVLHLSGISQAISASSRDGCAALMQMAANTNTILSYDPNFRPLLWSLDAARAGLKSALQHGPVLLPGLDDARVLTGLSDPIEIVRHFLQTGARRVAMTAGSDGVYVGEGDDVAHIPGEPADCVDASGAGDCFDGAFLVRLSKGHTTREAAIFANKAAAISVTRHGAASSIPYLHEVS